MRWQRRRGGNRELQEAQNTGEAQQEERSCAENSNGINELEGVQADLSGILPELLELLETLCDIEQENARACETEELQNLQRTENRESQRTSELQNFTIAKANRKLKIPFHIQSAKPSHGLK